MTCAPDAHVAHKCAVRMPPVHVLPRTTHYKWTADTTFAKRGVGGLKHTLGALLFGKLAPPLTANRPPQSTERGVHFAMGGDRGQKSSDASFNEAEENRKLILFAN